MVRLVMVAVALGGLLLGACAAPVELESAEEERAVSSVDEPVTRGKCENAVDEGADIWRLMCGALDDTDIVKEQCYKESNFGRANGKNKCIGGTCKQACKALYDRWKIYCDDRIPSRWKSICLQARERGNDKCLDACKGRSLDSEDTGTTPASCDSQNENSS